MDEQLYLMAVGLSLEEKYDKIDDVVKSSFARELERELAAMTAERDELRDIVNAMIQANPRQLWNVVAMEIKAKSDTLTEGIRRAMERIDQNAFQDAKTCKQIITDETGIKLEGGK